MTDIRVIESEPIGDSIVERLEETLQAARDGRLSSVAIAVVYRDGTTGRSWSKIPSRSTLVGSVAMLQYELIRGSD